MQQRVEEVLRLAQRFPLLGAQPLVLLHDGGELLLEGEGEGLSPNCEGFAD